LEVLSGPGLSWSKLQKSSGQGGHVNQGGGLPDEARLKQTSKPIPHPANLALFEHKISLYRFNQGAHTIAGGSNRSRRAEPPPLTLTTAEKYAS